MAISDDILIEWTEIQLAVSYNLYRSDDGGSVYNQIATGITETEYLDSAGALTSYYKVAGVDQFSVEGELSDPLLAYDPAEVCVISGSIIHPDGTPADGEPIEIAYYVDSGYIPGDAHGHPSRNGDLPRFAQGNLLTRTETIVNTDAVGRFEAPVVRLALVMFTVRQCGYQVRLQIPDVEALEIENLANHGEIIPVTEYPF